VPSIFECDDDFHVQIECLIAALPVASHEDRIFHVGFIATPLGEMLAIVDDEKLHMLEFCDLKDLSDKIKKLHRSTKAHFKLGHNGILVQVGRELAAYFSGQSAKFTISCAIEGSAFSRQVWQALQQIPVATSCSYREQAIMIGRERAYRAVARANSQNKIAIIIPCHRVIGANGHLTGYAGGIERKQWLLAHEQKYFAARS